MATMPGPAAGYRRRAACAAACRSPHTQSRPPVRQAPRRIPTPRSSRSPSVAPTSRAPRSRRSPRPAPRSRKPARRTPPSSGGLQPRAGAPAFGARRCPDASTSRHSQRRVDRLTPPDVGVDERPAASAGRRGSQPPPRRSRCGLAKRRVVARYASSAAFHDEQRFKAAGRVGERLKPAARRKADASLRYDCVGYHAQCAQLLASLVCEGRSITGF
jgi:hypothetical protein